MSSRYASSPSLHPFPCLITHPKCSSPLHLSTPYPIFFSPCSPVFTVHALSAPFCTLSALLHPSHPVSPFLKLTSSKLQQLQPMSKFYPSPAALMLASRSQHSAQLPAAALQKQTCSCQIKPDVTDVRLKVSMRASTQLHLIKMQIVLLEGQYLLSVLRLPCVRPKI